MRAWWRSCGALLCGLACLAGLSFPWVKPWLLGEAASRFSADGAITPHGATLLAFCWFLAAGLVGLAGCGALLFARPDGRALWRLFEDERRPLPEGRGRGYLLLGSSSVVAAAVVAVGLGLGRRRWLFVEDGPVEIAQVLLLGFAAALFCSVALRSAGSRRWPAACLAVGSALWLGEEISWGQRIFGWSTPEGWEKVNLQQETNLHNLVRPWPVELHNLLPLLGLVLLVASIASRWRSSAGLATEPGALARWLPPPSLWPLPLAALACQGLRLAGRIRSAEMEELLLTCLVFLWAVAAQGPTWPRTRPAK